VTGGANLDARSAHTDEESRYLARLDALLPDALGSRIEPSDVGSLWYGGVCIWLTVPNVPDGENPVISNTLQVLYNAQYLGAYWGCGHLWDDYDERDPEHLHVDASNLSPEAAAELAAGWLRAQLDRPLVRQEWDRPLLAPAVRWVLADTGRVLGSRGHLLRRNRRSPDRVVSLSPDGE
jgi:hypothetical protein